MSKKLAVLLAVVMVLAVSAVSVEASVAPVTPPAPVFTDGRLNAYDAGAPIVVYEPQTSIPAVDSNGLPTSENVVGGVQILAWDSAAESSSLALNVTTDQINKAIAAHPNKDFTIATSHGVSLGYSQSGWFWVTSAPDSEGKVYQFIWQKNF